MGDGAGGSGVVAMAVDHHDTGQPPTAVEVPEESSEKRDTMSGISFRDKLMNGPRHGGKGSINAENEEDDLTLQEGDLVQTLEDDMPVLHLSERIHAIMEQELASTIIVKLLGRRITVHTLFNKLNGMWKPMGTMDIRELENDYFKVSLPTVEECHRILASGPYLIYGQALTVQPWPPSFSTDEPFPTTAVSWVRLPGLPLTWYKRSLLEAIGRLLGKVLKLDTATETKEKLRFARLAVVVELGRPLISKIKLHDRIQRVVYENLPYICFQCGKYGHIKDGCPEQNGKQVNDEQPAGPPPQPTLSQRVAAESYGDWMTVTRQLRKDRKNANQHTGIRGKTVGGSRFGVLSNELENNKGVKPTGDLEIAQISDDNQKGINDGTKADLEAAPQEREKGGKKINEGLGKQTD